MSDKQCDISEAAADQVEAFWQLPAILFAGWCELTRSLWLLQPMCPSPRHPSHGRLVVPEPLEEAGEGGLFA